MDPSKVQNPPIQLPPQGQGKIQLNTFKPILNPNQGQPIKINPNPIIPTLNNQQVPFQKPQINQIPFNPQNPQNPQLTLNNPGLIPPNKNNLGVINPIVKPGTMQPMNGINNQQQQQTFIDKLKQMKNIETRQLSQSITEDEKNEYAQRLIDAIQKQSFQQRQQMVKPEAF